MLTAAVALLAVAQAAAGWLVSEDPLERASDFEGAAFLPIGAHKPAPEDLVRYVRYGFSAVPAHVDFSSYPEEGTFDFSQLAADLDAYARVGLSIELHMHTNGAPEWFTRAHDPGMWMRDQYGQILRHWSSVSYHYAPYLDMVRRFDRACVQFIKSRPDDDARLFGWDLANEPAYPRPVDAPAADGVRWFDHAPAAQDAFRKWLGDRYATIDQLNATWGTDFSAFSHVSAPRDDANTAAWVDWLAFREEALTRFLDRVAEAVEQADERHRPVVAKIMAGSWDLDEAAVDGTGFDSWARMAARGAIGADLYCSDFTRPAAVVDKMRCVGLAPWLMEFGGVGPPTLQDARYLHRATYLAFGRGARCLFYFTWGRWKEFSERGLCDLQGRPTIRVPYLSLAAHGVRRVGRYLAEPATTARIAMYDPRIDTLLMYPADRAMTWSEGPDPFTSVYGLLRRLHYEVDFVTAADVLGGALDRYKVLVMVGAHHVDEAVARRVAEFASRGGHLVCDAMTAALDGHGRPYAEPPLAGLFGINHEGWQEKADAALAVISPGLSEETVGRQAHAPRREVVRTTSRRAKVVAVFSDGRPAVVFLRQMRSRRMYVAADLGALAAADPDMWTELLDGFLGKTRLRPDVLTMRGDSSDLDVSVRTDGEGNLAAVIVNTSDRPVRDVTLRVADPGSAEIYRGYLLPTDSTEVTRIGTTRLLYHVGFALEKVDLGCVVLVIADGPPIVGAKVSVPRDETERVPVIAPGEAFTLTATVDNPSDGRIAACRLVVRAPRGWAADSWASPPTPLGPGARAESSFAVKAPQDVPDDYYPLVLRAEYDGAVSDPCTVMVHVKGEK